MEDNRPLVLGFWTKLTLDIFASLAMTFAIMGVTYILEFWPSSRDPLRRNNHMIAKLIEEEYWLIVLAGTITLTVYQQIRRRKMPK